MACLGNPVNRKQQYISNPLLKIRSDQVFSHMTATISQSVLDLFPNSHRVFLEMLQAEAGVALESEETGNVNYIIKGCFEQILLAKIKLEKCVIDLQMDFLAGQFGENNLVPGECDVLSKPTSPNNTTSIKLKKVPQRQSDKQKHSKTSYVIHKENTTAAKLPIKVKSRRKVGRPRKIENSDCLEEFGAQVKEPTVPGIAVPIIKREKQDLEKFDITSSYDCNITNVGPMLGIKYSESETSGSVPIQSFEAEAERKANEWLAVSLHAQENELDNGNGIDSKDDKADEQPIEYSCELCSFTAQREGQFLKHVLIHGKRDNVHLCDKCDFSSVSLNHFQRHKLSHSDSIFKCPQCPYKTDEAKQLARHVTVKHTMANIPPKRSSILECTECTYKTAKIYHFERHLLVHNRDLKGLLQVYHCEMCPYKTHRKEHYQRHRDNVHLRHRPYQCNLCSRSYKREDALQQHKTTAHSTFPQLSQIGEGDVNGLLDMTLAGGPATGLKESAASLSGTPATTESSSASPSIADVPEFSSTPCSPGALNASSIPDSSPLSLVRALRSIP